MNIKYTYITTKIVLKMRKIYTVKHNNIISLFVQHITHNYRTIQAHHLCIIIYKHKWYYNAHKKLDSIDVYYVQYIYNTLLLLLFELIFRLRFFVVLYVKVFGICTETILKLNNSLPICVSLVKKVI